MEIVVTSMSSMMLTYQMSPINTCITVVGGRGELDLTTSHGYTCTCMVMCSGSQTYEHVQWCIAPSDTNICPQQTCMYVHADVSINIFHYHVEV